MQLSLIFRKSSLAVSFQSVVRQPNLVLCFTMKPRTLLSAVVCVDLSIAHIRAHGQRCLHSLSMSLRSSVFVVFGKTIVANISEILALETF